MKRLKSHPFKVNLISLTLLFPLYSYAETTPNEELEVIGVRYAKPITVAEPAQTTINWSEIEEQQYSNFASMIDAVPAANVLIFVVLMIQAISPYLSMALQLAFNNTATELSFLIRS